MREIKFRAWIKKERIMLPHSKLFRLDTSNEIPFLQLLEKFSVEWEIMQYTGLNDKNGVEIYEDDLIKNDRGTVLKVAWYNGSYFAEGVSHKGNKICDLLHFYASWSEVIGNIHQNPELLNS